MVRALPLHGRSRRFESYSAHSRSHANGRYKMTRWEYLELKITYDEVEIVDDELQPSGEKKNDPYDYVKRMIGDGWELVTRSGSLNGEFTVVLKRPISDH